MHWLFRKHSGGKNLGLLGVEHGLVTEKKRILGEGTLWKRGYCVLPKKGGQKLTGTGNTGKLHELES